MLMPHATVMCSRISLFEKIWCDKTKLFAKRLFSYQRDNIKEYDVIIIGGGHAGTEACAAGARMGAKTLLITHKFETIGEMSCNPSFGGIGKGHLVREIDALDGICAKCCDETGVQYKILNKRRGPAVWGPRAQIDRALYKTAVQKTLTEMPNLEILCGSVENLITVPILSAESLSSNSKVECVGVSLQNGDKIFSKSVVITTGTFLRGQINIGLEVRPAGRIDDDSAIGLAKCLESLDFRMGRLKTGTPPRLRANSINYKMLEKHYGDNPPMPFSFQNQNVWLKPEEQLLCYLTYTNEKLNDIVTKNLHVNRHVTEEISGPRYCPSIESKVLRFGQRSHQIWLEPEGFGSELVYPNGLSCTLPEELQVQLVHTIPGLENAEVVRPGYGVEYDFVDPREVDKTLETKKIRNLFLAGQICGTTGYEEAASQGCLAGANAAAKALKRDPLIISRTEGYIGVLVDDLTTLGTNEPYRMFTSRAEFRLTLRSDNADLRLTEKGYKIGLVSEERYQQTKQVKSNLSIVIEQLKSIKNLSNDWREKLNQPISKASVVKSAFDMMASNDEITPQSIVNILQNSSLSWIKDDPQLCNRIKIEAIYAHSIDEQSKEVAEVRKEESLLIPRDIDYFAKSLSLSNEERNKLTMIQPQTIASASRIQGVTPATIVRLLRYVKLRSAFSNNLTA